MECIPCKFILQRHHKISLEHCYRLMEYRSTLNGKLSYNNAHQNLYTATVKILIKRYI